MELGLKLTKLPDNVDLSITKDRSGPLFLTQQTSSMFILIAYLKGYRRKSIKIDINKDGSRITISGEKLVQETSVVEWEVVKKDVEVYGFRRSFKIPNGVVLDKIKARFDKDESRLTIWMPKSIDGVTTIGIEEVKEEEVPKGQEINSVPQSQSQTDQERPYGSNEHDQDSMPNSENQLKRSENKEFVKEKEELKAEQVEKKGIDQESKSKPEPESSRNSSKLNAPIIAGSALFVSLMALVFHLIGSRNQSSRKRD